MTTPLAITNSMPLLVVPGTPDYFFERGMAWHKACDVAHALEDFDQALALDPGHNEARLMRARLLENRDVGQALAEYDLLLAADGAQPEVRLRRAALRAAAGDAIGALTDCQAADRGVRGTPAEIDELRASVARERAALFEAMGYLHGAQAEYQTLAEQPAATAAERAQVLEYRMHALRMSSRVHWKAGRFEAAAQGFAALAAAARGSGADSLYQVWHYLSASRASNTGRAPREWPVLGRPHDLRVSRNGNPPGWEPMGPATPTARWPAPVLDLFAGRIGPRRYLGMAEAALAESDAWQLPALGPGIGLSALRPPARYLWRSEVMFYLGQFHLIHGNRRDARMCLEIAAADNRARSFECYAAAAELARI